MGTRSSRIQHRLQIPSGSKERSSGFPISIVGPRPVTGRATLLFVNMNHVNSDLIDCLFCDAVLLDGSGDVAWTQRCRRLPPSSSCGGRDVAINWPHTQHDVNHDSSLPVGFAFERTFPLAHLTRGNSNGTSRSNRRVLDRTRIESDTVYKTRRTQI